MFVASTTNASMKTRAETKGSYVSKRISQPLFTQPSNPRVERRRVTIDVPQTTNHNDDAHDSSVRHDSRRRPQNLDVMEREPRKCANDHISTDRAEDAEYISGFELEIQKYTQTLQTSIYASLAETQSELRSDLETVSTEINTELSKLIEAEAPLRVRLSEEQIILPSKVPAAAANQDDIAMDVDVDIDNNTQRINNDQLRTLDEIMQEFRLAVEEKERRIQRLLSSWMDIQGELVGVVAEVFGQTCVDFDSVADTNNESGNTIGREGEYTTDKFRERIQQAQVSHEQTNELYRTADHKLNDIETRIRELTRVYVERSREQLKETQVNRKQKMNEIQKLLRDW